MSDPISQLPNPLTPMAWFEPKAAQEITISAYVYVGATAILIWDMLTNVQKDWLILFMMRTKFGIPTIAYFVSRFATLAFILGSAIYVTAPIGNCSRVIYGLNWTYPIAVSATSLLFFFRVRAIYEGNKYITAFFGVFWLLVVAGTVTVPQGVWAKNIGTTDYCVNTAIEKFVAAGAMGVPLCFDTLVFVAITVRIAKIARRETTLSAGVQTVMFGKYLPAFSRALLVDGQVYYLTTVTANMITIIMLNVMKPVAYKEMLPMPNLVITNVMACRVFRNTKFLPKRLRGVNTDQTANESHILFPREARNRLAWHSPMSIDEQSRGDGIALSPRSFEGGAQEGVAVTKTIAFHSDEPSNTDIKNGKEKFERSHLEV